MNVKTVFAAVVVVASAGVTALAPGIVAAQIPGQPTQAQPTQAQRGETRAELYRRALLAGKEVPCRTNASCAALGVAALEAGRVKEAQTLVAMEGALAEATTMQADEENSPKASSSARARVAMAYVHQGDVQAKLGQLSDARASYRTAVSRGDDYPNDVLLGRAVNAARERLAAIAGKDVVQGVPPGGAHFVHYLNFDAWNSIATKPVKGRHGVYRIDGDFMHPTVGDDGQPGASTGNVSAYVRFHDGVARVPVPDTGSDAPLEATAKIGNLTPYERHDDRCLLEFRLSAPETLDVLTHGSVTACGFGVNVTADGRYYLVSGF
nr:hypothetical protein HUO10_005157 [Paraburkholderia busanensis]